MSFDAIATNTITTNGDIVALDTRAQASAVIVITGTWTGAVQFEYAPDTVTWYALPCTPEGGGATVTSATAAGVWRADVAAFPQIRVRASAVITGTATVRIEASALHVPTGGMALTINPASATSGTIVALNGTITLPVSGYGTWGIQVTGTWVGTLTFQASMDGGATYNPVNMHVMGNTTNQTAQTTTANGRWDGSTAIWTHVQVTATAWTSGAANIALVESQVAHFIDQVSAMVFPTYAGSDAVTANTVPEIVHGLYNGTTVDRMYNNMQGTLLASAARTASAPSALQTNYNARGVMLFLSITAITGTGVTVQMLAYDPVVASLSVVPAANSTNITATGEYIFVWYPGAAVQATQANRVMSVSSFPVPRSWESQVLHSDGNSVTYSLGYSYLT